MISSQPAIPLLVHEDCIGDIKTDLAKQQASLSEIADHTNGTNSHLTTIEMLVDDIQQSAISIKHSSSNTATQLETIKTDTTALTSSVGTTADASSSNTVIGLLKSILNKLSL